MVAMDGGASAEEVVAYFFGLFTFTNGVVNAGVWWVWHMLALQFLLMIIPFSHLLHFGGIFLSRQFLGTSDSFAGEFGENNPK